MRKTDCPAGVKDCEGVEINESDTVVGKLVQHIRRVHHQDSAGFIWPSGEHAKGN
jgi:hypothetical protein